MNFLIAGASGFIGTRLVHSLSSNHQITVLGRKDRKHLELKFGKKVQARTWQALESLNAKDFDVVINLSGHNIAASRWSNKIKQLIIDSRVNTNAVLINWLIKHQAMPHYYSANAIGIYGLQKNGDSKEFDEDSAIDCENPIDFLSEVGIAWQDSIKPAIDYGISVTTTRFGVALEKGEGMLKKLEPSFKFGLGSLIGDGKQILSWIHINDIIRGFHFLFHHPELIGPVNFTAPNPISQGEFAKAFARVLHRPLFLKTPHIIIRTFLGEMGECLINQGQRVLPKRLTEAGFRFDYPTIDSALQHEYGREN